MSEYVTLVGAEKVHRAAVEMHDAATRMESAARDIHGAVDRLERLLEQSLQTLEIVLSERKA